MMEAWKSYILSILIWIFVCGILQKMIAETRGKKMIQLISGVVLAITVFSPLTRMRLDDYFQIPKIEWENSDLYIMEGQNNASEAQKRYIQDHCEAYILDRARTLNAEITVEILLNESMIPAFAQIEWDGNPSLQIELEKVLMTDLGIPKENQQWIWHQENNSS